MIVLDASVIIAHLDEADAYHVRASELLVDAADQALSASPLTLAEVFVGPARSSTLDAAQTAISELGVVSVPLAQDAPVRLATMRARTGLRLPDCCVLLAAETVDAKVATFDDRLASATVDFGLAVWG